MVAAVAVVVAMEVAEAIVVAVVAVAVAVDSLLPTLLRLADLAGSGQEDAFKREQASSTLTCRLGDL